MKIKDFLIDYVLKAVVGFTVCAAMVAPCACAESLCGSIGAEDLEHRVIKVAYEDYLIGVSADGTEYHLPEEECTEPVLYKGEYINVATYEEGDILKITVNPHGEVIGINGKCWNFTPVK